MTALFSYLHKKPLKQVFTCSALFFMMISRAQQQVLYYDIVRSREVIGHLVLFKTIKANKTFFKLESDVKTKFLFSYCQKVTETVVFENDKMIYSNYYQNLNGREMINEAQLRADGLIITKKGKAFKLPSGPVLSNILQLYTEQPLTEKEVFSNHYQQFLKLTKHGTQYMLMLPDGNYNLYTYTNGLCSQMDIVHTFFTVQFILKKSAFNHF